MKTSIKLLAAIFFLNVTLSHAKKMMPPNTTPVQIKFASDDRKDKAKNKNKNKDKDKKAKEDKMKRPAKPGIQNKSKRAEEQKANPPRTIIVV